MCALASNLEIPLPGVLAVIVFQGAFNIDGMRLVPLDQVAVVAVYGPHEICQRRNQAWRETAAKPCGFLGQIKG